MKDKPSKIGINFFGEVKLVTKVGAEIHTSKPADEPEGLDRNEHRLRRARHPHHGHIYGVDLLQYLLLPLKQQKMERYPQSLNLRKTKNGV